MFSSTLSPDLGIALAAALYWLGMRRSRSAAWRAAAGPERVLRERWRTAAFAAALLTIAFALGEPIDHLSDELFWVHMTQHVLLLVVAAPLLVLSAPWMTLWRVLPLHARRKLARSVARRRWSAPLRALARLCWLPAVAFVLMNTDILAWHLPAAYDLTLRSNAAHYAEHASFLLLGCLGWAQAIDSPPMRSRLDLPRRGAFAFGSMVVGWLLAVPLGFSGSAWYTHYSDLHSRPGGISAVADQHLAAGVMWVPASVPWSIAIFVLIYIWVSGNEKITKRPLPRRVHA